MPLADIIVLLIISYAIGGSRDSLPVFLLGMLLLNSATDIHIPPSLRDELDRSTTCDRACQRRVVGGVLYERENHAHEPLDAFYAVPVHGTFDSARPGTVLKVEAHTEVAKYTIPSGLTMSRIMYASRSLNGTIVPVSAFVLWPYVPFDYDDLNRPDDAASSAGMGFPIVAWAHGSSGLFAPCAPSNYRSLQYNFMMVYALALEGFAVIATDYAGLGVTLPDGQDHAWLAGPAGADDVAYAIEAARTAFPDVLQRDGPFVTMGHSQGGHVSWAFAERMVERPVPGYRGSIAISPPTDVIEWVRRAQRAVDKHLHDSSLTQFQLPPWVQGGLNIQPRVIAGITAVYPEYNYSGMSEISYDRWHHILKPLQGCMATDSLAFSFSEPKTKKHWTRNRVVKKWAKAVSVGGKRIEGPLLVIAGEEDVVPVGMLRDAVQTTCKVSENRNQSLELVTYEGMGHFPVIQASRALWMRWVKERVTDRADAGEDMAAPGMNGSQSHYVGESSMQGLWMQWANGWIRPGFDGHAQDMRDSRGKEGGEGRSHCGSEKVMHGFNANYTVHSTPPNWLVGLAPVGEEWKYLL
ncbi:uncharacterized protein DSM5745_10485 [Aspergillus mulundensis]|uniref:AB hydrolase-1 domain-containing protein n=1 Tax=Aspergillus mulundensis TaxID=1810919 RepID=A0A3D8QJ13_9EURO|nr:hypothetical protein DSM5745_10485 [Aspergillus mulundensis]RDW61813.1 hypothetical protein DSM5745_10485 [Aspergillus mulundensis]